MPFQIIRSNITQVTADAIVNTANPHPAIDDGVDRAIYKAAGSGELLRERKKIGVMLPGQAAINPAFRLKSKYIIHTVGPVWVNGEHDEYEQLRNCYENSLHLAKEYKCESVAFPVISTGTYGFPKDKALEIAVSAISQFVLLNEIKVYLVVFDTQSFKLSGMLFDGIEQFIDENYVSSVLEEEYNHPYCETDEGVLRQRSLDVLDDSLEAEDTGFNAMPMSCKAAPEQRSLDDVMSQIGENFQERLLRLIDERNMTDVEVYKKANLDRKLFSKIRCNPDYKPKKKTALALAIALRLNLDETKDLLGRAELALSPVSKFDLIIEYFIENEVYDVYTINMALFKYQQPMLGE